MKLRYVLSLLGISAIAFSSAAFSQNQNSNTGGFTGPSAVGIVTVEQAKEMKDDAYVILQGNIKQNVGEELYVFADSTGEINIEIDSEDWNGLNVGPQDNVQIKGEVEKGWTSIKIDVNEIIKK